MTDFPSKPSLLAEVRACRELLDIIVKIAPADPTVWVILSTLPTQEMTRWLAQGCGAEIPVSVPQVGKKVPLETDLLRSMVVVKSIVLQAQTIVLSKDDFLLEHSYVHEKVKAARRFVEAIEEAIG